MSVSRKRLLAYLLALAVFIQLFGMVNIVTVKTKNNELNIGISSMCTSLAPPVNKPAYFGEKTGDNGAVLSAVLIYFIGDIMHSVTASADVYKEFYPVISRKILEVFKE